MSDIQRHLATVLCADVKDYSLQMQSDEESTIRLLHRYRAFIDPLIIEYGGRIANTAGDSIVAEFMSVINAVKCAVTIQEKLHKLALESAVESLSYRFGVHLGDVISKGQDILGDSVNIAARIEGVADAGGVCISKTVFDSIQGKLPYHFEDMGEKELKNIAQSVRVYKVIYKQLETKKFQGADEFLQSNKPSIAVLPLDNMSNDPEQEYFSDGLTEDIITDLSKVSGLIVIARNSTFTYKNQSVDLRRVGIELGVKYILEGSVRKSTNRLRITVQLIEAANGSHIWAERYDRILDDIFDLQDEITHTIVNALKVHLTPKEIEAIDKKETGNIVAYELLSLARQKYYQFTKDGISEARELIKVVISQDHNYIAAYVLIAHTHIYDFIAGYVPFNIENLELAKTYINDALKLAPGSSEVLGALGWYHLWSGEHNAAIENLSMAVNLDPNSINNHNWLSYAYSSIVLGEQAIDEAKISVMLNPLKSVVAKHAMAVALFSLERYKECIALASESLEMNPFFLPALVFDAAAKFELNKYDSAKESFNKIKMISPNFEPKMCNLFSAGKVHDKLDFNLNKLAVL